MNNLRIEKRGDDITLLCDSCFKAYKFVRGFVHQDDNAHAVYFAALHDCQPNRIAHLAIVIGDWDEEGHANEVLSVGIKAQQKEDAIALDIVEPAESPWNGARQTGRMLTRTEALANLLRDEFRRIAEYVVANDEPLSRYLNT
ncbi:MAG: hypothetical protein NVSMB56_13750 [Pyrinomonadaceae bacterium]